MKDPPHTLSAHTVQTLPRVSPGNDGLGVDPAGDHPGTVACHRLPPHHGGLYLYPGYPTSGQTGGTGSMATITRDTLIAGPSQPRTPGSRTSAIPLSRKGRGLLWKRLPWPTPFTLEVEGSCLLLVGGLIGIGLPATKKPASNCHVAVCARVGLCVGVDYAIIEGICVCVCVCVWWMLL